ncbi:hypothetical protein NMG60_11013984 [Bertholletia excelsa]
MRDFPSCFGENAVQIADSSSSHPTRTAQNVVVCVYQCRLGGNSCFITVTWTKNLMGQGLSISVDSSSSQKPLCKFEIKPWLFSKRKGSKNLELNSAIIDVFWDLSNAKFGSNPEPIEGFYLAIVCNGEIILLLGDLKKEAHKRIDAKSNSLSSKAIFVAKRENIFGKKLYFARTRFFDQGQIHDVTIECDTAGINDPSLVIRIDSKAVMQVKRLRWKFRGNHTILIDGSPVEVFWDVHNWLFAGNVAGAGGGDAVFLFQTCHSAEKLRNSGQLVPFPDSSSPSLLGWSISQRLGDSRLQGLVSPLYCMLGRVNRTLGL